MDDHFSKIIRKNEKFEAIYYAFFKLQSFEVIIESSTVSPSANIASDQHSQDQRLLNISQTQPYLF